MVGSINRTIDIMSLSARRAWIEIRGINCKAAETASLSARRAWIEILPALKLIACHNVALRKESVDRNAGVPAHS